MNTGISVDGMEWLSQAAPAIEIEIEQAALEHQNNLTKPPGSLGLLEEIAIRLCGLQNTLAPRADNVFIAVFAGDHGVADEGVSAFPQAVTAEMVKNFANGGAAISVLAKQLSAQFAVINMGTVSPLDKIAGVQQSIIAPSTANFCQTEAMSQLQLDIALNVGKQVIDDIAFNDTDSLDTANNIDLFIGGDMGIANTTAASAIICALTGIAPHSIVGPGTGVDEKGVQHKAEVVARALALHKEALHKDKLHKDEQPSPISVLRCLGGFEIAALAGSYIRSAQRGIPVLVDGFITTAAALVAMHINPSIKPWLLLSHQSAEPGHKIVLEQFQGKPIVQLNMRLGEASGAATVVPLIRFACALHNGMASFASAGVSKEL